MRNDVNVRDAQTSNTLDNVTVGVKALPTWQIISSMGHASKGAPMANVPPRYPTGAGQDDPMQRPMRVCVCVGTVNEQKWRPRPTLSLTMRKWARLCRNCQSWWMSSQLARGSGQSRTCVTTTMLCMCIASPAFLGADASSHSACRAQAEDMTRQKQARSAHMMPKSSVFDPAWQVKTRTIPSD